MFFVLLSLTAKADHITGGEMFYTFGGFSNGTYKYNVTLKLFMRCNSGRVFSNPTVVSVFDRITGARIQDINVSLSDTVRLDLTDPDPCISNPPPVCYVVGYYNFEVNLPGSANGYIISSQVNYRIAGISNLTPGYGLIGATYIAEIPGNAVAASYPQNNSAQFIGSDLVVVCSDNIFTYSFAATDPDGDQLRYSFCNAFTSGQGTVPPPPPYAAVPYGNGYSSDNPLGNNISINSNTGLITGTAPPEGVYVVTVCVQEVRNGVVIATQRKDLQIKLSPCSIAAASLPDEYLLCKTSMTLTPVNLSTSPLINTTYWEFLNNTNQVLYSSTSIAPSFTFPDTGMYKVRLVINRGDACADSTTSMVKVYPGFRADFSFLGECFTKPTRFTDLSTTVYGVVNGWSWDFGEITMDNDQSTQRNPQYTYPDMGWKTAVLIAKNSKGCLDTIYKDINIVEKPPVNLAFRDTLICKNDNVQLRAIGTGQYSWTPNTNIINANTATPVVSPKVTTTYYVFMDEDGCTNTDSVKVRVVDAVSLQAMGDTTICEGDTIQLRINTNGLLYSWSPTTNLSSSNIPNPNAVTQNTTTYTITSTIGGCSTTDQITVRTVPYPIINAGRDTTICFGTPAYLYAASDASSILWSGTGMTINAIMPNPIVYPKTSTTYIVSATDNRGCPKSVYDSITVNVLPEIKAYAGRDTSVITGQVVQLNASGGVQYTWSPSLYLSANNIADPKAVFDDENERIRYKVLVYDNEGCRDSAFITVRIFKTGPMVFVPTAFTPNNDGKNDKLRPIAAGIAKIEFFRVFNRWGQLVYSTQVSGEGWDGKINGHMQSASTYVWVVKAIDYRGETYLKKGTVTLIR